MRGKKEVNLLLGPKSWGQNLLRYDHPDQQHDTLFPFSYATLQAKISTFSTLFCRYYKIPWVVATSARQASFWNWRSSSKRQFLLTKASVCSQENLQTQRSGQATHLNIFLFRICSLSHNSETSAEIFRTLPYLWQGAANSGAQNRDL